MKKISAVFVLLCLSGCSSFTPITPAGQDTYIMGAKQRGGFKSWEEIKANAYNEATAFCAKQGKQMQQVDMQTHGVRGWTPQEAELTFKCVPKT